MKLLIGVPLLVLALIGWFSVAQSMSAQEPTQSTGYGTESTSPFNGLKTTFRFTSNTIPCRLRSADVHASSTEQGYMAGKVTGRCTGLRVDQMWHYAQMQRRLSTGAYINIGSYDTFNRTNTYGGSARSRAVCQDHPYGYRVTGWGYIVVNGELHFATHQVRSPHVTINPCNL